MPFFGAIAFAEKCITFTSLICSQSFGLERKAISKIGEASLYLCPRIYILLKMMHPFTQARIVGPCDLPTVTKAHHMHQNKEGAHL